jgi:chromosome segregation ATPase
MNGGGSPMQTDSEKPGPGEKRSQKGTGQSNEPGEKGQGGGSGEPLEDRAADLAEAGKTLKDILNAIAKSDEPADQEAARQIGTLLQEGKLEDTIERMQGLVGQIREKQEDAGMGAAAVADNLESAARELDSLHRQIVAPRVADLMKLEQEATELAEKLDNLETEMEITDWHRLTDELLADLEKAGLTAQEIDDLREAMKAGGWGPDAKRSRAGGWGWDFDRTRFGAPVVYTKSTRKLVEKLQSHIQELVLRDMLAAGDEAAPPEYERQIEKYYEILSAEKK